MVRELSGKNLLVTGATGLLGKALVEKLLRSVPALGRIYLLVRPHRAGQSAAHRAKVEIRASGIFAVSQANALWDEKIRIVPGDLSVPGLGLTGEIRRELIEDVDMVVNVAAAVKFNEPLKRALAVNVDGPLRLLELARAAGAAFMQVSTCFVAGQRHGNIPEQLPGMPSGTSHDPEQLLAEARRRCGPAGRSAVASSGGSVSPETGATLASEHGWCDIYTFTKWLAEHALARAATGVPLIVVRPSIIESSLHEPFPGWIEGIRMLDPMILSYGRGKLTSFPGHGETVVDVVPLDLVVNGIIVALCQTAHVDTPRIYQISSGARNPLRLGELADAAFRFFRAQPLLDGRGRPIQVEPFRYVGANGSEAPSTSDVVRKVPARAERRLGREAALAHTYAGYAALECRFVDEQMSRLMDAIPPGERERFPCDVDDINWPEYLATHISAIVSARTRTPVPVPRSF